jgi:26S proteasome regulatory subunit N9
LSLVDICSPVVNRFEDAEEALQFLEKIGDKVKANTEAFVMTRVLIGKLQLVQIKDTLKTKAIVEEIDGLLHDVQGVGKVHAHYYLLATDFYKTEGDHANYYRYILL